MFTLLFVESYFLYDCKPAPSVLWVCACSRVFMAGSVALERRIAVPLEGPISLFVSQDAAGFRLMQNDIKISCSDARSRSICLSAHVTWQPSCFRLGPALGSAHRECPSSDGMIAVADICRLGGRCCRRANTLENHIRSHSTACAVSAQVKCLSQASFYGHCSFFQKGLFVVILLKNHFWFLKEAFSKYCSY